MKRQRSILRSALLLVPVLATMGAVPRFAQAQSSGPADSVWVADDQTAQSNCTINGLPCAPGTVFYVHRVPLAAAQAAHKPYLAGTANSAEQDGFLESRRAQVRPAQTATVSPSIPGLSCTARPYTDAGQAYLNTIGSSVSESSTYYVDSWCNRFARSYSTSLVSGPLTYKNDTSDRPHLSWRTLAVYGRPFSPFLILQRDIDLRLTSQGTRRTLTCLTTRRPNDFSRRSLPCDVSRRRIRRILTL